MIDLFQPFRIGNLELRNRFIRSATWDATADKEGMVTDESVALYNKLGRGDIGLIITGHAFISPTGQAGLGQYGIHNDKTVPGLRRLVTAVHKYRGKIAVQISHSGINAMRTIPQALAVSSVASLKREQKEMTEEDIELLLNGFAQAAVRAREAGFDALQLHGAHGYLLSQFLSPLSNLRTDHWGGSIRNRRRFHLEVIRHIRQAVGTDFPLLIKFGVRDESDDGLTVREGVATALHMCKAGIDAIEISAGTPAVGKHAVITRKSGEMENALFRDRAATVKRVVKVPVILVGGIRTLALATDIINSGDADMISMSRPFIREPGLLKRWQQGSDMTSDCISCNRCFPPRTPARGEVMCRKEKYSGA